MEEKILHAFKIVPTPQRIEILRLILKRRGTSFTVNDLKDDIRHVSIVISDGTLVTTLQLFHTRHVLTGSPGLNVDKGRPPLRYTLGRQLIELLDLP